MRAAAARLARLRAHFLLNGDAPSSRTSPVPSMRSHALIRACFVAASFAAALALLTPMAAVSAQPAPPSPVTFLVQGKGWGHGRGMGQWGALGYALQGWTSNQILDHYYGGTTMGTLDPNGELRVRLLREDDVDVIVVSEHNGLTTSVVPGAFTALRAQPQPDGTYLVQSGPGCAGPWTPLTTAPSVDFRGDPSSITTTDATALLAVCEAGGTMRYYRGSLLAVRDANGASRAVNVVPLDTYVRGVVPREVSAAWGDQGSGSGLPGVEGASGRGALVRVGRGSLLLREDVRRIAVSGVQRRRRSQPGRCAVVARGPAHRSCRLRDCRTGAPRQQRRRCPH